MRPISLHRPWRTALAAALLALPGGLAAAATVDSATVQTAAPAADPQGDAVVYLLMLDAVAAPYLAGRDAYLAGAQEAAALLFARPMAEGYAALEPVLLARGGTAFLPAIEAAVEAALQGRSKAEVAAKAEAVLAALRRAAKLAPVDGRGEAAVQALVLATLVEQAAALYGQAVAEGSSGARLAGYGLRRAAEADAQRWGPAIAASSTEAAAALGAALDLLAKAYPSVTTTKGAGPAPEALAGAAARLAAAVAGP